MAKKIVILEDNAERKALMAQCLQDRFYQFERRFFDEAGTMVDFLKMNLQETILISLDHDLEIIEGKEGRMVDPGTGREVANFLAAQAPVCPIVLHSTNSAAVAGMKAVLDEAGWEIYRVVPCADTERIRTDWFRAVRKAIVKPARAMEKQS